MHLETRYVHMAQIASTTRWMRLASQTSKTLSTRTQYCEEHMGTMKAQTTQCQCI